MNNKIKLTIGGINYYVSSNESEHYMQDLGDELNRKLTEISNANMSLSTTMSAVLAALDFADERNGALKEIESLKEEIKKANSDAAAARLEVEEARREIERLSRENRQLRLGNKF